MKEKTKNLARIAAAAVLALAALVPALAGDEPKVVQLTGYITDEWCGAKNANPEGAGCARDCARKGSELAIVSDGKMYRLSAKDKALEHLGHKVVVTGTLDAEGKVVQVRTIEKAKDKA